jgi:hypothetical protein
MEVSPPSAPPERQVSLAAFKKMLNLNKLFLEAGWVRTPQELIFAILNQSIQYVSYNRAMLWDCSGRGKCLGISGNAVFDAKAEAVQDRLPLVNAVAKPAEAQLLAAESFAKDRHDCWESVSQDCSGTAIAWCPIVWDEKVVAVLWLERWGGASWNPADLELLKPLLNAYAVAWRPHLKKERGLVALLRRKSVDLALLALLLVGLFALRLPLRIVAPCEVVPKDPIVITAPLDGVVDRVVVQPGKVVEKDQLLFSYAKQVPLQDLNVARQQVRLIWSDLQRARAEAFRNPDARQLIALLETRLEQEQGKLKLAEHYASQLEMKAPRSAVVMMGDPNEWTGRPVALGEKVMQLIDPANSKLMIWLPQDDKVEFDAQMPIKVILNAKALKSQFAVLSYQAQHAELSPTGASAFLAEAQWLNPPKSLQMGLKGHAVLRGSKVSLAYWLFRRPLAAFRGRTGL